MIPDDNPGLGYYMTLKDVQEILEVYGEDAGCKLTQHEIDQALAGLREGNPIALGGGVCIIQPEGGPGLYCGYLKGYKSDE